MVSHGKLQMLLQGCRATHQAVEPENGPEQSVVSPNWSSADRLDASAYFLACLDHI